MRERHSGRKAHSVFSPTPTLAQMTHWRDGAWLFITTPTLAQVTHWRDGTRRGLVHQQAPMQHGFSASLGDMSGYP